MERKLWGLFLLTAALGLSQPVWADDLYVVAGGGRMVGTAITPTTPLPYIIKQPGFYYLTGNLTYSGNGNAITINVDEVTLDLMGFCITGPGSSSGSGIVVNGTNDGEVRNGSVKNCYYGVLVGFSNNTGSNCHLSNLRVSGCTIGIADNCIGGTITGCHTFNNNYGFVVWGECTIIDKNTAYNNSSIQFQLSCQGGVVTNNVAYSGGTGFDLPGKSSQLVDRNSSYLNGYGNWAGLDGCTKGLNTP